MSDIDQDYYAAAQLYGVLEAGPAEGEDFFRLQVSGKSTSKWINVPASVVEEVAAILLMGN